MEYKPFASPADRSCARVTTGNTLAPCVIIGKRAAEILQAQHTI
jgi:hypothetical protein